MTTEIKTTGKIIFSKNIIWDTTYKVEDPRKLVSSFFYTKLGFYGFIEENDNISIALEEKKKIRIENNKDIDNDILFAITGNVSGIFQYHLDNMITNLEKGNNVWVNVSLLGEFISFIKQTKAFDQIDIDIEDKFDPNSNIKPNAKSISILLGLFGKFYGKKMNKKDSINLGKLEEKIKEEISENEIQTLKEIVIKQRESNNFELPQVNLFAKLLEGLDLLKK